MHDYDVFLSYRHGDPDETFTRELRRKLEADGYKVAIDKRDFASNGSLVGEMERFVIASRFTVAIVSERYLKSGYCLQESLIRKVLDMGQLDTRQLIRLNIENVRMPTWMFEIIGIDFTEPDPEFDPYEKLKRDLGTPINPI